MHHQFEWSSSLFTKKGEEALLDGFGSDEIVGTYTLPNIFDLFCRRYSYIHGATMTQPSNCFRHTTQGAFLAQWACTEDRLGRVGTMTWSSWSTVVLLLIMAATIDTTTLLLPVSMLTYFIIGERHVCAFVALYW